MKFKKVKTWGSPHLQFGEHHVFRFFIFYKKYGTFDFFLWHLLEKKSVGHCKLGDFSKKKSVYID